MTSTTETSLGSATLQRELLIDASPETVWEFLVDPRKMVRWMGIEASLDPRPGGAYRCEVIPGHTAVGEVVAVEPQRRLVLTWGWEPDADGNTSVAAGTSTVEIVLEPHAGGTHLTLTHRDLPDAEVATRHAGGWDHYLARLVVAGAGGDPGPDPWLTPEA
jgi:uncharacterized protein YndB with AHSA1/START domain